MAKKLDPEFLIDTRKENRKQGAGASAESSTSENTQKPEPSADLGSGSSKADPEKKEPENKKSSEQSSGSSAGQGAEIPNPEPEVKDNFKEKFDEYFKGMDGLIGGEIAVNIVDDLKSSALLMYARKNGIDKITKADLAMDEKSKKFAAFLVDHAMKNNLFEILKKYPLLSALGVIVISGGSTFLMLQMLKNTNAEAAAKEKEYQKRERESAEKLAKMEQKIKDMVSGAEVVKDLNETK